MTIEEKMQHLYKALSREPEFANLTKRFDPSKDWFVHTTMGTFEITTWEDGGLPVMIDDTVYFLKDRNDHRPNEKETNN